MFYYSTKLRWGFTLLLTTSFHSTKYVNNTNDSSPFLLIKIIKTNLHKDYCPLLPFKMTLYNECLDLCLNTQTMCASTTTQYPQCKNKSSFHFLISDTPNLSTPSYYYFPITIEAQRVHPHQSSTWTMQERSRHDHSFFSSCLLKRYSPQRRSRPLTDSPRSRRNYVPFSSSAQSSSIVPPLFI